MSDTAFIGIYFNPFDFRASTTPCCRVREFVQGHGDEFEWIEDVFDVRNVPENKNSDEINTDKNQGEFILVVWRNEI